MTTPILTREDALEAAAQWVIAQVKTSDDVYVAQGIAHGIRALAARIPPQPDDVAGLVERLRQVKSPHASQAVDMLEAQSATIAALEARIAAADRLADRGRLIRTRCGPLAPDGKAWDADLTAYLATKGEQK